jgi:hypothetical protein
VSVDSSLIGQVLNCVNNVAKVLKHFDVYFDVFVRSDLKWNCLNQVNYHFKLAKYLKIVFVYLCDNIERCCQPKWYQETVFYRWSHFCWQQFNLKSVKLHYHSGQSFNSPMPNFVSLKIHIWRKDDWINWSFILSSQNSLYSLSTINEICHQ